MADSFIRNLTFSSEDLGVDSTLVLTFQSQKMKGIYKQYFPTAWKVTTFKATGPYEINVTYRNQLYFIKPQVSGDVIVAASTWQGLELGQKTDLTGGGTEFQFTEPEAGQKEHIQAYNKTGSVQGIGIALQSDPTALKAPSTVLYWDQVGDGANVTAQFTPTLFAYITSDYQENEILRGAIQTDEIWKQNLATLPENSSFKLTRDDKGHYHITKE